MVDTQDLKYVTISGTSCNSISSGYVSTSDTYTTAIPNTTSWSTTA